MIGTSCWSTFNNDCCVVFCQSPFYIISEVYSSALRFLKSRIRHVCVSQKTTTVCYLIEFTPRAACRKNIRLRSIVLQLTRYYSLDCFPKGTPPLCRSICRYCKCERYDHQAQLGYIVGFERCGFTECTVLGLFTYDSCTHFAFTDTTGMATVLPASAASGNSQHVQSQQPGSASYGYAWVPPGLNRKKVSERQQTDNGRS